MSIEDLSAEELYHCFEDLHEGFSQCQFQNCAHNVNSKGCFFHSLNPNDFEDQVMLERLSAYKRFLEEIDQQVDSRRK